MYHSDPDLWTVKDDVQHIDSGWSDAQIYKAIEACGKPYDIFKIAKYLRKEDKKIEEEEEDFKKDIAQEIVNLALPEWADTYIGEAIMQYGCDKAKVLHYIKENATMS
eukprot:TRINITY_DN16826_c0_g1_i1.p1 TRINITY_DN16826_c0_g1~~TRINITY_DN16826_c0_g1_i1.p1  ORF type:complete len:108 (-),score=14.84 TRINITY_DN16826_c0_g1_i1:75-398(-)